MVKATDHMSKVGVAESGVPAKLKVTLVGSLLPVLLSPKMLLSHDATMVSPVWHNTLGTTQAESSTKILLGETIGTAKPGVAIPKVAVMSNAKMILWIIVHLPAEEAS